MKELECPICQSNHSYWEWDLGTNPRNAHSWDGEPNGSVWRECEEQAVECPTTGRWFHIDVDDAKGGKKVHYHSLSSCSPLPPNLSDPRYDLRYGTPYWLAFPKEWKQGQDFFRNPANGDLYDVNGDVVERDPHNPY
jgi:hypothetical protein